MPKHTDDKDARGHAEDFFGDVTQGEAAMAAPLVNEFPIVEFETASKTIEGESVTLRRVVLVGPWEVVK
jgi:hypothetical protein